MYKVRSKLLNCIIQNNWKCLAQKICNSQFCFCVILKSNRYGPDTIDCTFTMYICNCIEIHTDTIIFITVFEKIHNRDIIQID